MAITVTTPLQVRWLSTYHQMPSFPLEKLVKIVTSSIITNIDH
jgi:hypothetical protein